MNATKKLTEKTMLQLVTMTTRLGINRLRCLKKLTSGVKLSKGEVQSYRARLIAGTQLDMAVRAEIDRRHKKVKENGLRSLPKKQQRMMGMLPQVGNGRLLNPQAKASIEMSTPKSSR